MPELREEVARAMCVAQHIHPDAPVLFGMRTVPAWEARLPAADAAIALSLECVGRYLEGHGGVIPGTAVFASLISGNNMPCMSGDPRDRLLPHRRRQFDDATHELATAIRKLAPSPVSAGEATPPASARSA